MKSMFNLEQLKSEGYSKFTLEDHDLKKNLLNETIKLYKSVSNSKIKDFTLSDMVEIYNNDKESWSRFYEICSHQSGIFKILSSETIFDILKECNYSNPGLQKNALGLRFDFPNTERTMFLPHQDLPYNIGGFNNLIVWLPLFKTFKEMGSLRVYPKTHLNKIYEYEIDQVGHKIIKNIDQFKNFEEIFVDENEGVIFSSTLIHSSGRNISDIPRITLIGRYFDYYDDSFVNRNFDPTPLKFEK